MKNRTSKIRDEGQKMSAIVLDSKDETRCPIVVRFVDRRASTLLVRQHYRMNDA